MNIAVIGGGAAGMTAAFFAAINQASVTILEKNDRVGIKLRATGNGKCNYSNTSISVRDYQTDSEELLASLLNDFGTDEAIAFFREMGMISKVRNGGLYPATDQASTVLEVLMYRLKEEGVRICTEAHIDTINRTDNGYDILVNKKNEHYDRIILCCGGKAAIKTNFDRSGYALLQQLHIPVTELYPSLVQLRAKGNYFKQLSGIRCDANLELFEDGDVVACEEGELQITDYGISGIPVFQLSGRAALAIAKNKSTSVKIDLIPQMNLEEIIELMKNKRKNMQSSTIEELMVGTIHKKWIPFILKKHRISPNDHNEKVSDRVLYEMYSELKNYYVEISDTNGFENAQVTRGGVLLSLLDEHMMVKSVPGCFLAGEIINVDGRCGGYNLHWAWLSGRLAGIHAAQV